MQHEPEFAPVNQHNVDDFPFMEMLYANPPSWTNAWVMGLKMKPIDEMKGSVVDQDVLVMYLAGKIKMKRRFEGCEAVTVPSGGSLFLRPRDTEQSFQWESDVTMLHIGFNASLMAEVAESIGPGDGSRVELYDRFDFRDRVLENFAYALLGNITTDDYGAMYADQVANAVLMHLLSHYSSLTHPREITGSGGLTKQHLNRVVEYVDTHLHENIKLKDLAACVGLSQVHFLRAFKQSMEMSPHQYLINQRIERVVKMMREDPQQKLTMADIAFAVGFSDQSHLARMCKRQLGVSPKQVRAKMYPR